MRITNKSTLLSIAGIIILFSAIYLYKINIIPPLLHPDEALMIVGANEKFTSISSVLSNYYSTSIISLLPMRILSSFLPPSINIFRLPSVFFGVLTLVFLFLLNKTLFSKKTAILSVVILGFSHVFIAYSRLALPNIYAPLILVTTLYMLTLAIRKDHTLLWAIAGVVLGFSFYVYTGARVTFGVVALYLLVFHKSYNPRRLLILAASTILIVSPLLLFSSFNEFLVRESQVMFFTRPEIFYEKWQTTNPMEVLTKQIEMNIKGFYEIRDNSNQYGNGPLLDKFSQVLIFISLLFAVIQTISSKDAYEKKKLFVLLASIIFIFLIISLSESPPLSNRLIILFPLFATLAAYSVNSLSSFIFNNNLRYLEKSIIVVICLALIVLNLNIYFVQYLRSHNAYYNWIEPISSIGQYVSESSQENTIFLLADSHTYSEHTIFRAFSYIYGQNKSIINITTASEIDKLVRSEDNIVFIVPLTPKDVSRDALQLREYAIQSATRAGLIRNYQVGTSCKNCPDEPLFVALSKNDNSHTN